MLCDLEQAVLDKLDSPVVYSAEKNETVFKEGTKVDNIFCLRSGHLRMYSRDCHGDSHLVAIAKPGEPVGFMDYFNTGSFTVFAEAGEDTEFCRLNVKDMEEVLKDPKASRALLHQFASRLRMVMGHQANFTTLSVRERVARTLLFLADQFGTSSEGEIKIQLSRKDLADLSATVVESFVRTIRSFQEDRVVKLKAKRVWILNRPELEKIQSL